MWNRRFSRSSTAPHYWEDVKEPDFLRPGLGRGYSSPISIPERSVVLPDIKFSGLMLQACDPAMGVYNIQAALRLSNSDARKLLIACISKMKSDHEAREEINHAMQDFQHSLFSS